MSDWKFKAELGAITLFVETLAPEKARAWLESSTGNRPILPKRVSQLADQMRRGRWNWEFISPFKFDREGHLFAGHHRCRAVIQAGVEIDVLVAHGCPARSRNIEFLESAWSLPDALSAEEQRNANSFAAAAQVVGKLRAIEAGEYSTMTKAASKLDLFEEFEGNSHLDEWVHRCAGYRKTRLAISASELAGFIYFVHEDPARLSEVAQSFLDQMTNGESIRRGDPAFMLRDRLAERRYSAPQMKTAKFVALVKAWNAFVRGETITLLRAGEDEVIPTIQKV